MRRFWMALGFSLLSVSTAAAQTAGKDTGGSHRLTLSHEDSSNTEAVAVRPVSYA